MADPLSIVGGIAATMQVSSAVVQLIKAVKDASSDRHRLLAEINNTAAVCQTLVDYAEMNLEPWVRTLQTICRKDDGPVTQFRVSLEYLQEKLKSGYNGTLGEHFKGGSKTVKRALQARSWVQSLRWPFLQRGGRTITLEHRTAEVAVKYCIGK